MSKLSITFILTISLLNGLDIVNISKQDFRVILENASRASNRVFVEDFTGLQ